MKVRKEINLLNRVLSAATGVTAVQDEWTNVDNDWININMNLPSNSFYFEIVTQSTSSIAYDVILKTTGGTTISTINVPTGTTSYTRLRSTGFSLSGTDFQITISAASGATKNVKAARLIWVEEDVACSYTQIEMGARELSKINTTAAALTAPKLWYYDSANYDGTLTFSVNVIWSVATTKNTCTITLQQDNGSFGSWTDLVTIVSAGTSTSPNSNSIAFTPTSGRNYRIASLGSTSKSVHNIYAANIKIYQVSSTIKTSETAPVSITGLIPVYAQYKLDDLTEASGGTSLTQTGSISFVSGKFGNAADFGYGGSISHGNRATFPNPITNVYTGTWSVSLWLKCATGGGGSFFRIEDSSGRYGYCYLDSTNGQLQGNIGGSNSALTGDWDDGNWHHFVWAKTASQSQFYMDGATAGSTLVGAFTATDTSGQIALCYGQSGGSRLAGMIDNVMFFQNTLSLAMVKLLYLEQLKKFETQMLLGNTTLSGTGLQDFDQLYDSAEWSNSQVDFYHEANSAAGGTSDLKLQNTSGPVDVTNSTITDAIERERTATLTMPASGSTIDVNVTSNASNIWANRIIAVVTQLTSSRAPRPISIGHPFIF